MRRSKYAGLLEKTNRKQESPTLKLTATLERLYNPVMSGIEWWGITPEEVIRDIENSVEQYRENKYAFQVGLKDLDFDINQELLEASGLNLPFSNIQNAERALTERVIVPLKLIEYDDKVHEVIEFDPRPVGYSGFMDCVTHSLVLTNHGLFEVGHYPAVNLSSQNRYWQWFLHRRLATAEEIHSIEEANEWDHRELIKRVYCALTGLDDPN